MGNEGRASSITHQESNIVNAIFRKLRNEMRGRSPQVGTIFSGNIAINDFDQDDERIENFRVKINEDVEEALRSLESNLEEV